MSPSAAPRARVPAGGTVTQRKVTQRVLAQLDAAWTSDDVKLDLGRGKTLHLSHLQKVFFPNVGVTKGDLLHYYTWVSPSLLPLLRDRALALKRFPNGVGGKSFFQQKAPPDPPSAVRVETIISESGEPQHRLIGGALATLLYCVQLGVIEMNPWNARVQSLETLDYTVIDLDPGPSAPFTRVVETARWVKEALDQYGLRAAIKTSGATGIHIFIPLPAKASERTAERVAERIARTVVEAHPRETTVQRPIKSRGGSKVYVDYGQNSRGKTVAAAYSVRPTSHATVSTPLAWEELTPSLTPDAFTVATLPDRVGRLGDLWASSMRIRNSDRVVTNL